MLKLHHQYSVDELCKASMLILDWLTSDEYVQVNGVCVVCDYTGTSLQEFLNGFTIELTRKVYKYVNKALPARLKRTHIYNQPSFYDAISAFLSPFQSQKLRERKILHGKSLVRIFDDVGMHALPREYLPDDYDGPSIGKMESVLEEMIEDMMAPEFRDYIVNMSSDKHGVDLLKRKVNDTPAQSFRKLHVD